MYVCSCCSYTQVAQALEDEGLDDEAWLAKYGDVITEETLVKVSCDAFCVWCIVQYTYWGDTLTLSLALFGVYVVCSLKPR
jgi:hypothetical protein